MVQDTRVKVIFVYNKKNVASWPYINYDFQKRAVEIMKILRESLSDIHFSEILPYSDQEESIEEGEYDGYLIYMMSRGIGMSLSVEKIIESGHPVVLANELYGGSGRFLSEYPLIKKKQLPVLAITSSNFEEVIEAVKLFEIIKKMKQAKILVIKDGEINEIAEKTKKMFGTEVIRMSSKELHSYYEKTDENEARRWKDKWIKEALRVIEPTEEEILKSARMYLALKRIMREKEIDAVTIDCLGLYYANKLIAYPCLAFFQLNNEGFTGVCEADIDSTVTQLLMRYLTGRAGYVSDPVIDTASNQIIYAHCVATNKVYGPDGLANPYLIRSHNEDRKGASVQSLMPIGEKITTVKISISQEALAIHEGKSIANVEEDKGCRTKLAVEAKARKILENWNAKFNFGWHRVSFYGDWKEKILKLATLLRLKVYEEDR